MKIAEVKIKNFFSIKDATIRPPLSGKTLITGVNKDDPGSDNSGCGKSSFIMAIGWCIFGEVPKEVDVAQVIHYGEKEAYVSIVFDDGTAIARGRTNTKSSLTFLHVGEDLTQRTTSQTQQLIFNKFGMKGTAKQCFMDFLNTVFLNSSTVEMFSSAKFTSSDRFKFLSRVLNLDTWKEMSETAREEGKDLKEDIDKIGSKIEALESYIDSEISTENIGTQIKEAKEQIESLNKEIKEKREELKQIERKNEQVDTKKESLRDKENNLKETRENFNDASQVTTLKRRDLLNSVEKIEKAEIELKTIEESTESYTPAGSVERIQGKINSIQTELDGLSKKLLNDTSEKLKEKFQIKKDELREATTKKEKTENEVINLKSQISESKKCPDCDANLMVVGDEIEKFNIDKINNEIGDLNTLKLKASNSIDNLKSEVNGIENEQKKHVEKILKKQDELINKKNKGNEVLNKAKDIDNARNSALKSIKDKNTVIKTLDEVTKESEEIVEKYLPKIESLKKEIESLKKEIESFEYTPTSEKEQQIKFFESSIQESTQLLGSLESKLETITDHLSKIQDYEEERQTLNNEYEISGYWVKGFVELRRMIIESALPRFESLINKWLNELDMPMDISLDTLTESKKGDTLKEQFNILIEDKTTSRIDTIETCSDGQKKRIGLAICFALTDLKKEKFYPFEFLLIDQLLDSDIDSVGVQKVMNILNQMNEQKFIISHNSEIKEQFSNVIWVEKEDGKTTIRMAS